MRVKYYFSFFIVFIIVFCGGFYTRSQSSGDITLSVFGHSATQHAVIWIAFGISIFFLFTLLFFAGNWFSNFANSYRNDKDFDHLLAQIYSQALHKKEENLHFKTKHYKMLSNILKRFDLHAKLDTQPSSCTKIDSLFSSLEEVKKGGTSSIKLPEENEFWTLNAKNSIRSDYKFAHKVLEGEYTEDLKILALEELAQNNHLNEKAIHKFLSSSPSPTLAKSMLDNLLLIGYRLPIETIKSLLLHSKLSTKDYLSKTQALKAMFSPDECIGLFEDLSLQDQNAREAYVFLLLDFSMMEKAQEFLRDNEDLILAHAFVDLKKMGKNYTLDSFFSF